MQKTPMGGGGGRGGCRQVVASPGWSDRSGADSGRGALNYPTPITGAGGVSGGRSLRARSRRRILRWCRRSRRGRPPAGPPDADAARNAYARADVVCPVGGG